MSENTSNTSATRPENKEAIGPFPINSKPPVGSVMLYAGGTDITMSLEAHGWMVCDGRTLWAANYPVLFALIGCNYGGSGPSFMIPLLPSPFATGGTGTQQALSAICYIICFV
jgi:hypothetical protein